MTDASRRLRLVTEAAHATGGAMAPHEPGAVAPPEAAPAGAGAGQIGAEMPDEQPGRTAWSTRTDGARGNRWGTPVLLSVRIGVVVLLLAVAATVTIVLTRPSAPAHQPEWARPEPPADWTGAGAPGDDVGAGGPASDGADSAGPAPGEPEPSGTDATSPDAGDPGLAVVIVHVAGAVREPGIVELPDTARVHDALTAAGGSTAEADLAALNLAAAVVDGQQVYVPVVGEEVRAGAGGRDAPPAPAGSGEHGGGEAAAVVNLNSAGSAELQTLPGIGPAMAERILAHRDEHGPFGSVEELRAVSGIGPATMERLRDLVIV
ncbi:helix-hairpin-helix domain-containing protein [Pseudactinotalea sp. Z1732]|uniref:helix-hairpin-helix domain-containing protein n=1 Tax=Pseudactinotalea sp. Z1732 TaxID=3413026 RepID=UPI003C7DF1FA